MKSLYCILLFVEATVFDANCKNGRCCYWSLTAVWSTSIWETGRCEATSTSRSLSFDFTQRYRKTCCNSPLISWKMPNPWTSEESKCFCDQFTGALSIGIYCIGTSMLNRGFWSSNLCSWGSKCRQDLKVRLVWFSLLIFPFESPSRSIWIMASTVCSVHNSPSWRFPRT